MKFFLLYITVLAMIACHNGPAPGKTAETAAGKAWSKIDYDFLLSRYPGFPSLYPDTMFAYRQMGQNDTCGIAWIDMNTQQSVFHPTEYFRCHTFLDSSCLNIDIGLATPHGRFGFMIYCAGDTFSTVPYSWNHMDPAGSEPEFTHIAQKLTLDKNSYAPGDSIYGKIYFHIIKKKGEEEREYHQQGIFRGRVTLPSYTSIGKNKLILDLHWH